MKRGVYRAFFVRVIVAYLRNISLSFGEGWGEVKRQGRRSFRFILSDATNLISGFIFAFFVLFLLNIM